MRHINIPLFIVVASAMFVTACTTSQKPDEEADATEAPVVEVEDQSQGATSSGLSSEESGSEELQGAGASEDAIVLPRVVYFDYDSSNLSEEDQAIIKSHAEILNEKQDWSIVLEGHADERGTREYNLALGQERAQAVADLLQIYDIGFERIQLVSYGEEEPAVLESNEQAWAENRRVEILY